MDRNQFIGLILMLVMLTVYFQYFAPEPPTPQIVDNVPLQTPDSLEAQAPISNETQVTESLSDSAMVALKQLKYGLFSAAADGTEKEIKASSETFELIFSSKGGIIKELKLKGYTTYDGKDLVVMDQSTHDIDILFEHLSKPISLNDLYFEPSTRNFGDSTEYIFTLNVNGNTLKQIYTVYSSGYTLGYRLESSGFEKQIDAKNLVLFWQAALPKLEREIEDERRRTTVRYFTKSGETDYISKTATGYEEDIITVPIKWLAYNQKFFTTSIDFLKKI